MSDKKHVLIVEDEIKIANLLDDFLKLEGFDTTSFQDGANVVQWVKNHRVDFIILDVMLPNKDGLTICKEIRQFSEVPILLLTARVDEIDRLMGLGFGADDYVCKPFSVREVVARVNTILKRVNKANIDDNNDLLNYKYIALNKNKFECTVNNLKIELTPVEFRLLATLINKPGNVFSRESLMSQCYEDARIVSNRTIDSHMKNLRSKLSPDADTPDLLHSIYGVGYKIE